MNLGIPNKLVKIIKICNSMDGTSNVDTAMVRDEWRGVIEAAKCLMAHKAIKIKLKNKFRTIRFKLN